MDNKKIVAAVGVAAGIAGWLLYRQRAGADEELPEDAATIAIRVLDSNGNEVPHNSPVELEPGASYTVEVAVTNHSRYAGEPSAADLTTIIAAFTNGTDLIPETSTSDHYGPGQSHVFTWALDVPVGTPVSTGAIVVVVRDPGARKLAEESLPITIGAAMRPAINGMGDLNDDGYVTEEDVAILQEYVAQRTGNLATWTILPAASPLPYWEFIRRADMTYDGNFDEADIQAMYTFIETGVLPEREYPQRPAHNGMGDLNDDGFVDNIDILLWAHTLWAQDDPSWDPSGFVTPLSRAEYLRRADMNADGVINVGDLLGIRRYIHYGEYDVYAYVDMNLGIKEGVTDLEPGETYTVQVVVTNHSRYAGEPSAADLTTIIEALVNGTTLIPLTSRADHFSAEESRTFDWPFQVPSGTPVSAGEIVAAVWSFMINPNGSKVEEVRLPITIGAAMRPAINGMGDLNDDGYVTEEDLDLLAAFIVAQFQVPAGSPLLMGEFLRRADFNGDAVIDSLDWAGAWKFVQDGTLPDPVLPPRPPINGIGDINDDGYVSSADMLLLKYYIFGFPISQLSPLSEAEFLRRGDVNSDGDVNVADIAAMNYFIHHGTYPIHYAASVDIGI